MNKFIPILLLNILLLYNNFFSAHIYSCTPHSQKYKARERKNKIFNSWDAFGVFVWLWIFFIFIFQQFLTSSQAKRQLFFGKRPTQAHACVCVNLYAVALWNLTQSATTKKQNSPVRNSNLFLMNLFVASNDKTLKMLPIFLENLIQKMI